MAQSTPANERPAQPDAPPAAHDHGPALVSSLPTDDPEFCEIVLEFIDRLEEQLRAMQQAWDAGNLEELSNLAHWLKGSGGTAGFPAFTQPAKQLGAMVKENRVEEIEATLAELRQIADRIEKPRSHEQSAASSRGWEAAASTSSEMCLPVGNTREAASDS